MGCLGVHFANTERDVTALRSIHDESARLDFLIDVIEETYFGDYPQWKAECDKSWDAMHRSFANGESTWDRGEYSRNHVVLGGELLYTKHDYIMSLKTPKQVREIAKAISAIDEEKFRRRYFAIDANDYGFPISEEDFLYTWAWFQGVRDLYTRAAKDNRSVLFTASQ